MAPNLTSRPQARRALAGGCSGGGSELEVLFPNYRGSPEFQDPALLRVDVDAAGRNYQLSGRDFTTERYGTLHSRRLPVPGRGELAAPGSLVAAGADTLASTRFTIALQPDYGYSASVQPGGPQPIGHCVGTVLAVPLRRPGGGESADTLWVTYGGLPDGATC